MNQASVSWHHKDSAATIQLYERAKKFLPNDYLITMFLGFNYIFAERIEEGKALLQKIQNIIPDHMISGDTISEDYLSGKTDAAGIQAIFSEVDEKRSSILEKQKKLEEIVAAFPLFRQGLFHLAITHLQLGREKEALPILERYISLHPSDPTANYYLSSIYFQRFNFTAAWKYLRRAEELAASFNHHPRALKELRQTLQRACPEPKI